MIGIFYGTRPEYIKLKPLLKALQKRSIEYKLFQVSQHTDLIKECPYDEFIRIKNSSKNRLNSIFLSVLRYPLKNLKYVLVQGDTTTAAAVALNAFHSGIKVIHLEAGMRSFDRYNPYPEESNRRIISSLADIHYCPTDREKRYLYVEGFDKDSVLVTGNTCIDNLINIEVTKTNKVLVTLHRRENQPNIIKWFQAIEFLANENPHLEFVFPAHPSPSIQNNLSVFKKVKVCDSLPHDKLLKLLASSHCVISDSGGIQEESSYFKKLCFVCRKTTERPSESSLLCDTPEVLIMNFMNHYNKEIKEFSPFGNGDSSELIAKDLERLCFETF
jgi:UDP-N-acetylglucosamine 2-epimerase (non-hydrolysing)